MVLGELGGRISRALAEMSNATVVDEAIIEACLKEITTALLQSDVNVKQVCIARFAARSAPRGRRGAVVGPMAPRHRMNRPRRPRRSWS